MRFTQDSSSSANLIRAYTRGELKINDAVFRDPLIISASSIQAEPTLTSVADLGAEHAARILRFEPEVVLVGTGAKQMFPAAAFGAHFLEAGIGFEAMDTGAACRTFNVLVSERRRVVALLLP
jgi:uncharacterized protein